MRSSASTIRSWPKPRQAVWAALPSASVDPVLRREVLLVVVERRAAPSARGRRSARAARTSAPARAGWRRASARGGRRTGRWRGRARRRGRTRAAARGPRCAHSSRQSSTVSGSPIRTSSRWWNICSRAGSSEGSWRNTQAPPASTNTPPGGQRAAGGDRRVDRVAGGRHERQLGHLPGTRSSPRGGRRARLCAAACASSPSNEKTLPARCGNELQVAARLELAAREQRREAQRLGAARSRLAREPRVERASRTSSKTSPWP